MLSDVVPNIGREIILLVQLVNAPAVAVTWVTSARGIAKFGKYHVVAIVTCQKCQNKNVEVSLRR